MLSMTAFGKAKTTIENRTFSVEIRSVNSRYLDCNVKFPFDLNYLEDGMKAFLQESGIVRGKVDVSLKIEYLGEAANKAVLNMPMAAAYIQSLRNLRDEFNLKDDISVMTVAANKELWTPSENDADPEAERMIVQRAMKPAIDQFLQRSFEEGERLKDDLEGKLQGIERRVGLIEEHSALIIQEYRGKLEARLKSLLADQNLSLDDARILTECAIFADKVAIDEELVRLRSHITSFRDTMQLKGSVGKLLDFTIQEMNRETNTIGSKCANAQIAHIVVELKNELEKIREQIQNIV